MKITKKQLKTLIREQVKAVIEAHDDYHDDDWFDVLSKKDRPPMPWGSEEEEESKEEPLKLPNPMKQRDKKYGNKLTSRQWINRVKDKLKEGQEDDHIIGLLQQVLQARSSGYNFEQQMLKMDPLDRQKLIQTLEYLRDSMFDGEEKTASVVAEVLSQLKRVSEKKRTAKGNITQDTREKYATVGKDKFPIFDDESADSALKLRGHTSKKNQEKIINKAAKYAPEAAKKAREAEKNK